MGEWKCGAQACPLNIKYAIRSLQHNTISKNRFLLSLSLSESMDEQSKYWSGQLETSKSERAVWLMKCPPVVSRSLQCPPPPLPSSSSFNAASSSSSIPSGPVAKVVVSINPLLSNDDPSSRQVQPYNSLRNSFPLLF